MTPSILNPPLEPVYKQVRTWEEVRDTNFSLAKRILDAAEIRFVEIDDTQPNRRQLAVDIADQHRLIAAFERHGKTGEYVAGAPWTGTVRLQIGTGTRLSRLVAIRRLRMSSALIFCQLARFGRKGRVFGLGYGAVVSFWERQTIADQPFVVGTSNNRWANELADSDPSSPVLDVVERDLAGRAHIDDVRFPIDLVVLWVDGEDPAWTERRTRRMAELGLPLDADERPTDADSTVSAEATMQRLYRSRDELRFAIRSAEMYAPFINHIYLVTDQQVPHWLDTDADGLTVVDHSEIFPPGSPPVFNSSALDTRLHHIPGLSEHFLVTNDDMLFYNPVFPSDFFTASGAMRLFLSKARIPIGNEVDGEPAVDSASRNTRRLVEREHGVTITQKFKHIPIPQRVSIRSEVAERYRDDVERTTSSSFRSTTDISFSHLTLYESLRSGQGVISSLPYDYIGLDSPRLDRRLEHLKDHPGSLKVICLNDADITIPVNRDGEPTMTPAEAEAERDNAVIEFLNGSFPEPSRFERRESPESGEAN